MLSANNPDPINGTYLVYLLEAFTSVLQHDVGIKFFVNIGMVQRLNQIIKFIELGKADQNKNAFMQQYKDRVNYLALDCLAKIAVNHEGKDECVKKQVI